MPITFDELCQGLLERISPTLHQLAADIENISIQGTNPVVRGITHYPSGVKTGWLYVVLTESPHQLDVKEALDRGACGIVVTPGLKLSSVVKCPHIVVADCRKAYSSICASFFGNSHNRLIIYAVTGTKGKTTTCHLLAGMLEAAGLRVGLISSLLLQCKCWKFTSRNTTPPPFLLHLTLRAMEDCGVEHVVLEASSIGLSQERLYGLTFRGVGFTNLGKDHLGYHKTVAEYQNAKSKLFTDFAPLVPSLQVAAVNVDDLYGRQLATSARGTVITFGEHGHIRPSYIAATEQGITGYAADVPFESSLLGIHNVSNILCAVAVAKRMNLEIEQISQGIRIVKSLPGRMQRIGRDTDPPIFVDYAHTPESVLACLQALRQIYASTPIVVIVGCGGNTDRGKRPVMARISFEHSDICILTSDNPRSEDPESIVRDMQRGLPPEVLNEHSCRVITILDRRAAIFRGVELICLGGVLAILGKGHEQYQVLRDSRAPFDDAKVSHEALLYYKRFCFRG